MGRYGYLGYYASEYGYEDLRKAVEAQPTQENINALGEWFQAFGLDYWNGESYDADGVDIFPIYKEVEEDEFELIGYEMR